MGGGTGDDDEEEEWYEGDEELEDNEVVEDGAEKEDAKDNNEDEGEGEVVLRAFLRLDELEPSASARLLLLVMLRSLSWRTAERDTPLEGAARKVTALCCNGVCSPSQLQSLCNRVWRGGGVEIGTKWQRGRVAGQQPAIRAT